LQPVIATVIFAGVFTRVVQIPSDNQCPYPLFAYSGLVAWTFFANALALSSNSLVASEGMIRKTYFPRLLIPLGAILALIPDMLIGFGLMAVLMVYYGWHATLALFWLPIFMIGCFLAVSGMGLVLSALNVRFRDIKYVVPFFIQMAFFLTPVVYPMSHLPQRLKLFLGLNPMAGMVEGIRHALLGTPVSWALVWSSAAVSVFLFVSGLYVFRRLERTFADVI
jgi:lipopolysaccharide transport system permease protein